MVKPTNIVTCEKCGREYGCQSGGNPRPGVKGSQYAICTYCGAETPSEMISGFNTSYKLYDDGNPICRDGK